MIVIQVLLTFIIFVGLGIGLYWTGLNAGFELARRVLYDDEPVVYRHIIPR